MWTNAFELTELSDGDARLFRDEAHQVAVFRTGDELHAVDNLCPHEGYPLVQGTLDGPVLTCCWHNYKFDVRDGGCIKGAEAVRCYATRVQDGRVQLDLSPPDRSAEMPRLYASLEEGLVEMRMGQVCRDIARLLQAGVAPERVLLEAVRHEARRGQYGSGHALAVAADLRHMLPRYPGVEATVPLAYAFDQASRNIVRRRVRDQPAPADVSDPDITGAQLRARVEAEDVAGAEALVRGAVRAGWGREVLEPWFFHVVTTHHLSFGHPLIYSTKVFDLLDAVDWAEAEDILAGLVCAVVNATREDVLPEWAGFRRRLAEVSHHFPRWAAQTGADWDRDALRAALDGGARTWFAGLVTALEAGADPASVAAVISQTAAERLLWFDTDFDWSDDLQDTWLYTTHVQTTAAATRAVLARSRDPELLRGLFHAARMANRARALDLPQQARPVVHTLEPDANRLRRALRSHDEAAALGHADALLRRDPAQLRDILEDWTLDRPAVTPIVVSHCIKNTVAAFEEHAVTGDPNHVLAAVRFLAAEKAERSIRRTASEAVAFVAHQRKPRTLTG